ncbi:MAG: serine/threonine protein kinase [Planctomycetota bacterium]|nr:MAG: serine/threonine protein kinase [Planctomycetota bacterium]
MTSPRRVGPYTVLRRLGAGGMGTVFEALDPAGGRRVALKLLRCSTPALEARLVREAEVLARLRHRNVVRVHEVRRFPEGLALVQELVPGETLAERAGRGLNPWEAADIVRDLAEALAEVHRRGVLHRDLKPSNVVLRPDGIPVLLDFGVAHDRDARTLTETGALVGTPSAMSPEQVEGRKDLDPRVDVYGLGVLFYRLLCGRSPYEGSPLQVLRAILAPGDPPSPREVDPAVPESLDAVVRRCMRKNPAGRYRDASALGAALEAAIAQRDAPPAPAPRRGPLPTGLALACLALFVALGFALRADSVRSAPPDASRPSPIGAADSAAEDPTEGIPAQGAREDWLFAPGERFVFAYRFAEEGRYPFELAGRNEVRVTRGAAGRLRLRCTARWVRLSFGAGLLRRTASSEERVVGLRDPLERAVRAPLGKSFHLEVDPRSGEVLACEGMAGLGDPLARELEALALDPLDPADVVRALTRDAHVRATLDALWHQRGQTPRWTPTATGFRLKGDGGPPLLRPYDTPRGGQGRALRLRGRAEFGAGRLRRVRIEQRTEGSAGPVRLIASYARLEGR